MFLKLRDAGVWAGFWLAGLSLLLGCESNEASTTPGAAGEATHLGGASAAGAGGIAGSAGAGASGSGTSGSGMAGAPSAGAAGQAGTICEVPPTAGQRKAPAFPATTIPNPVGLRFRFMNNCPMTIWVQTSNAGNQFPGGIVQLISKATAEFDMPKVLGRINAYTKAPPGSAGSVLSQFSEMNAAPNIALNVNLSHVDWLALPVEIRGIGTDPSCTVTGCYQPFSTVLVGCPAELLDTNESKCHAPNWYCGTHAEEPFCQALMASAKNTVDTDPDCAAGKGTTFTPNDVFGCAAFFGGHGAANRNGAACCAKVNRNFSDNATKQSHLDNCAFYKQKPFNVYAQWAHQQCPFIYAFAYDDVAEQSGFLGCNKGTEMDITYCPGDP